MVEIIMNLRNLLKWSLILAALIAYKQSEAGETYQAYDSGQIEQTIIFAPENNR